MYSQAILSLPAILNLSFRFCSSTAKPHLIIGASASVERKISSEDVRLFSELSGDWNPIHHDKKNAVVHGGLLNGFVSGVIGTKLPGPGTLLLKETFRFPNPCYVGDTVIVTVELTDVRKIISCKFNVTSKTYNNVVMEGEARLLLNNNYEA